MVGIGIGIGGNVGFGRVGRVAGSGGRVAAGMAGSGGNVGLGSGGIVGSPGCGACSRLRAAQLAWRLESEIIVIKDRRRGMLEVAIGGWM